MTSESSRAVGTCDSTLKTEYTPRSVADGVKINLLGYVTPSLNERYAHICKDTTNIDIPCKSALLLLRLGGLMQST